MRQLQSSPLPPFPKTPVQSTKVGESDTTNLLYFPCTAFTFILQIHPSYQFNLPPHQFARHPVIPRRRHINRLHKFTYIPQFSFFLQSSEMTVRRSPRHAAHFLKIITEHYIVIGKIFLQPHIYLYFRQGFRVARILAPADLDTS